MTSRSTTSGAASEAAAIRRAYEAWIAAIGEGHIDTTVAGFAPDAVMLPPDEPAVTGHPALRAWAKTALGEWRHERVEAPLAGLEVAGDWAWGHGDFRGVLRPRAGGAPLALHTRFVLIWRRQPDGGWRIAYDIWNRPAPPT